jgi:hypothetical protein
VRTPGERHHHVRVLVLGLAQEVEEVGDGLGSILQSSVSIE